MPNKWHVCKEGQRKQQKKDSAEACLCFLKGPSRPSAGSQSGCFRTSLGRKRVAHTTFYKLIRVFIIFDEGRSNSSWFASKRSKVAHGACWDSFGAKTASTDAQISGPNLQENRIIDKCKEEECAVSTKGSRCAERLGNGLLDTFTCSLDR
jgi:hypothetical protein